MRGARRLGLASLVLGLAASALLHQRAGVLPIFDGIIVPPQPYRWESPPPNLRSGNQPPESGDVTLPIANGQIPGGGLSTGDSQVSIYFAPGIFKAQSGSKSVTCTIDPVANPPAPPPGADIRGNVYRFVCTAQPGGGAVTVAGNYHLTLRFPPGGFQEIQFYDGSAWQALPTAKAPGGDPYAGASLAAFGEFAATAPPGAQGDTFLTILGQYVGIFGGILAFVVIFGLIAVVQEIRHPRRPATPTTRPRKK